MFLEFEVSGFSFFYGAWTVLEIGGINSEHKKELNLLARA